MANQKLTTPCGVSTNRLVWCCKRVAISLLVLALSRTPCRPYAHLPPVPFTCSAASCPRRKATSALSSRMVRVRGSSFSVTCRGRAGGGKLRSSPSKWIPTLACRYAAYALETTKQVPYTLIASRPSVLLPSLNTRKQLFQIGLSDPKSASS